jgi:hypothetical protein
MILKNNVVWLTWLKWGGINLKDEWEKKIKKIIIKTQKHTKVLNTIPLISSRKSRHNESNNTGKNY